jgi:hypothetical protein
VKGRRHRWLGKLLQHPGDLLNLPTRKKGMVGEAGDGCRGGMETGERWHCLLVDNDGRGEDKGSAGG